MATPSDIILRNTRALQPTPSLYAAGILYYVTDENILERWSGVAWENVEGVGGGGGGYTEGARVYNDANISIANSTFIDLTFNQERYDTDGIHSTGSNTERLTCQTAGKYLIIGSVYWAVDTTFDRRVTIYLNGTTWIQFNAFAPAPNIQTGMIASTIYDLSISDYVTLRVWQNTGNPLNVEAGSNFSPEFMMQRIG